MNATELRSAFLQSNDRITKSVQVPEWGMEFFVRSFTAAEAMEFRSKYGREDSEPSLDSMVAIVIGAAVDADGANIFQPDDAEALKGKRLDVLARVVNAVTAVVNPTPEDIAKN